MNASTRPEREDNSDPVVVPGAAGEDALVTDAEKARQGHTGDGLRYVLIVSLVGIVVAFAVVYFAFLSR